MEDTKSVILAMLAVDYPDQFSTEEEALAFYHANFMGGAMNGD